MRNSILRRNIYFRYLIKSINYQDKMKCKDSYLTKNLHIILIYIIFALYTNIHYDRN